MYRVRRPRAEAVLRVPRGVLLHAEGDGRQGGVPAQGVERAQEGVQEGDEGEEAARGGGVARSAWTGTRGRST